MSVRNLLLLICAIAVVHAPGSARADSGAATMASAWSRGPNAGMRLIAGGARQSLDGAVLAGVELKLERGWKTYWRNPGDSGVPPVFDWSQSKNLESVRMLWPAPRRFVEAGGTSNGYLGDTVFPLALKPKHSDRPIELRLNAEFGICREICIPGEAKLALTIPSDVSAKGPHDVILSRALNRVPATGEGDYRLGVEGIEIAGADGSPKLMIDVRYPKGDVELFVEAGTTYLSPPRRLAEPSDGHARFAVPLEEAQLAEIRGRTLTLTLVAGRESREVSWLLD